MWETSGKVTDFTRCDLLPGLSRTKHLTHFIKNCKISSSKGFLG